MLKNELVPAPATNQNLTQAIVAPVLDMTASNETIHADRSVRIAALQSRKGKWPGHMKLDRSLQPDNVCSAGSW